MQFNYFLKLKKFKIYIHILLNFSIKKYIQNYLYYGLSHSLELGAFLMQFLNWWHSENFQSKFIAYPIPNPPMVCINYCNLFFNSNI